MSTFTTLLRVVGKQECKPTAVISDEGFRDFGWPLLFSILCSPARMQMTQTHTTEVQKTLPTTAVLLNKRVTFSESGTSQNKCIFADKARGECSRAPQALLVPQGLSALQPSRRMSYSPKRKEECPHCSH